jgi:hypothetical protein
MSEQSIGDILDGNEPEPEAVTEEVTEQPEAVEEQPETVERPRGPDGKFIAKDTGVEAAEAAEPGPPPEQTDQLPPNVYAPLKAIRDENKELKAAIAALQQQARAPQPQVQAQPPVDFWDDPQAFLDTRLSGLGEELLERFEQRQQARRLDVSEQAAKAKYPDYDEKFAAFEQAVQLNPKLAYELAQAPDPGEFAYSRGKTALEIQRVGSIDELKAQIRAELEAEARAAIQPVRQALPSTTAADGSVGSRSGPEWVGPTSISDILR